MKRTAIKRRTPLRKVNPARRKRLFARNFGEKKDWIVTLACCVCGRRTPGGNHPHHIRSRGAGGTSKDLVPLCAEHHHDCHRPGYSQKELEHDWQVSLTEAAARCEEEWRELNGESE